MDADELQAKSSDAVSAASSPSKQQIDASFSLPIENDPNGASAKVLSSVVKPTNKFGVVAKQVDP